jgi:phosphonate transport system substrate-binding protein
MKKICFIILLLSCLNVSAVYAQEQKLSILPRFFPEKINAMMQPLASYLSRETGMNIDSVLMDNFADYKTAVLQGKVGLGYENPLVYVEVSSAHEVLATAVKGKGGDRFRGIIITRPESEIASIDDLKGKKIMIVSHSSAGGFLSQKRTLQENGLDVERDCVLVEAADNKQENVIISVSIGDVDAGFIGESALHKADEFIMPGSVRTRFETAWLPNWAFSVNRDLNPDLKVKIQTALLNLHEGSSVLKAMELKAFKAATDADYDVIRHLVEN